MLVKKCCSRCKVYKGLPQFSYLNKTKGTKHSQCNKCRREKAKQWRLDGKIKPRKVATEAQKARKSAYGKEYYQKTKDRDREKHRIQKEAWDAANVERLKQYRRERREIYRQQNRDWQLKNPEKNRARAMRYLVRKRQQFIEDVDYVEVYERDNWTCKLCGESVDSSLRHPDPRAAQLDHIIPLSRGGDHSYVNVQCAHALCNQRKLNRTES